MHQEKRKHAVPGLIKKNENVHRRQLLAGTLKGGVRDFQGFPVGKKDPVGVPCRTKPTPVKREANARTTIEKRDRKGTRVWSRLRKRRGKKKRKGICLKGELGGEIGEKRKKNKNTLEEKGIIKTDLPGKESLRKTSKCQRGPK